MTLLELVTHPVSVGAAAFAAGTLVRKYTPKVVASVVLVARAIVAAADRGDIKVAEEWLIRENPPVAYGERAQFVTPPPIPHEQPVGTVKEWPR